MTADNMIQEKSKTDFFNDLLIPNAEAEKIALEAKMIQLDFIARLKELMEIKNIKSKKEFAELLNVSPSFITQIFSAEKLISLKHLAKIQRALDIKYSIISDLYLRHKNSFKGTLASKGYLPFRVNPEEIASPGNKNAA